MTRHKIPEEKFEEILVEDFNEMLVIVFKISRLYEETNHFLNADLNLVIIF